MAFMLDKYGRIRIEASFICFVLCAFIAYKRMRGAYMFDKSIHYMHAVLESLSAWLFLVVTLHDLASSQLTLITLLVMTLAGFLAIVFSIMHFEHLEF